MWHVWHLEPAAKKQKRVVRRRHRLAISCSRCRRLKVKCDRQTPCENCKKSKRTEECTYVSNSPSRAAQAEPECTETRVESSTSSTDEEQRDDTTPLLELLESPNSFAELTSSDFSSPLFEPETDILRADMLAEVPTGAMYSYPDKATIWLSKFRGETHWAVYMKEFKSFFAIDTSNPDIYPPLPPSHPSLDGSDGETPNMSLLLQNPKSFILSIVPDRGDIGRYVESYLATIERIYRILHIPTFREEVESFWNNDQTPRWDWLAQLLMVIGIGCLATPNSNTKRVPLLLRAAEICLLRMSFILNPTVLTINALCMMVIAKYVGAMSCHEYDSCGPLMGIVIRHAISIGMHCDPALNTPGMSPFQIEMRRRLWSTIVQLELQQSITSGMPPLLRRRDYNTLPPSNLNDEDLDPLSEIPHLPAPDFEFTDSSYQILLSNSFGAISEIVMAANSLSDNIPYSRVTHLDTQLREFLMETTLLRNNISVWPTSPDSNWKILQTSTLELTFRRVLLILHQRYARQPLASIHYPTSYWSALECSLAVLVHQRQIHEDPIHHESANWFAELFKNDFFMAIIIIGVQLCRKDNTSPNETDMVIRPAGFQHPSISPRSTILQTLKWCQDIWTRKLAQSFCHSKGSDLIARIIQTVESEA